MNAQDTMAISKAMAKKDTDNARKQLTEGRYAVDALVRVTGEVVVGSDTERAATSSLMSVDFLLLTLKTAGVTRDAAMKAIQSVADGYLTDWTGSKEDKKEAKKARKEALNKYDPNGHMSDIFDKVKADLPKVPVKGSVKFEGTVEQIDAISESELIQRVG